MTWQGYNEALFLYVLALGSPTHPVPESAYAHWLSGYKWLTFQGTEFVSFGPLFGHQYSACWLDFRGIQDSYMREKKVDLLREFTPGNVFSAILRQEQSRTLEGLCREYLGLDCV